MTGHPDDLSAPAQNATHDRRRQPAAGVVRDNRRSRAARAGGLALRAAALALAGLLALVGWFGGLYTSENYHEVIPGELYRSGQLDGDELTRRIREDGIRSVLNLRGENAGSEWYDQELAATRAAGIAHLDFSMRAGKPMSAAEARRLLALMAAAPKPLLVHCDGGSDRTGLASALYLLAAGQPERGGYQLSARFGHVGIEGATHAWPMTESWRRLQQELAPALPSAD